MSDGLEHESPSPSARLRWVVLALGLYVFVGGLTSFLGYPLDVPRLTDWANTGVSIQPNAALCVTFSGLALILLVVGRRRLAAASGALVLVIGGATLAEWITGLSFGHDGVLLFGREWGRVGVLVPGRMGPPGSTSWTLIGVSLLLTGLTQGSRRRRLGGLAPALALLTTLISAVSLLGYLYGADPLFTIPRLTAIAMQTATFIMAVSLGVIASHPGREPMRTLMDPGGAGMLARRTVPTLIVVAVGLGYLRIASQRAGILDVGTGVAMLVLLMIALLSIPLWRALGALRRRERTQVEAENRVAGLLGSITDAFFALDPEWRFTYISEVALKRLGLPREQVIGRQAWELFPDVVGSVSYVQLQRAMKSREPVEYEMFYEPWGRWFYDRAFPTPDGGLAVYSIDITERKNSEEALAKTQQRLEMSLRASGGASWGWNAVDNQLDEWTSEYRDLYGFAPDEPAKYETWLGRVHPQDRERLAARAREILETPGDDVWDETFRILHPQRGERWISGLGRATRDDTGRVVRMAGVNLDLTARTRAEQALRESQRLLQAMLSQFPAAVGVMDVNGVWTLTNSLMERYVPRAIPSALPDRTPRWRAWDDQGKPIAPENWPGKRALRGEEVVPGLPMLFLTDEGEERWMRVSATPMREEHGQIIGATCVVQDIDDIKRAEDALRDSEHRLRLALDAGRMGTWEWRIPTNEVVWSPGLEAIHGLAPGEFPGTFEAYQKDIHPDDRERVLRAVSHTLEAGQDHHVEYRIVLPDGTTRWVEGRGKLFRDASGSPSRMIGVCVDVTERKLSEEALRAKSQEIQAILDLAPVQIWFGDAGCKRFIGNRRAYEEHRLPHGSNASFDAPEQELPEGMRLEVNGRVLSPEEMPMQIAARTGRAVEGFEHDVVHPDGVRQTLIANVLPLKDPDGSVRSLIGVYMDISERKRLEQELIQHRNNLQQLVDQRTDEIRRAEKALARAQRMAAVGTLATGLAHDMKNVLLPLSARLDSVMGASGLTGEARTDLTVVIALLDHLREMARNLSLFANDPEHEGVDGNTSLAAWCLRVKGLIETAAIDSSAGWIRVKWDVPANLPALALAPHRLTQVVLNLVHNARDAIVLARESDRGVDWGRAGRGCITIAARAPDAKAVEI